MSLQGSIRELALDAGPLIALARIDLLDLPARLFEAAVTTSTVVGECTQSPEYSETARILAALTSGVIRQVEARAPAPDAFRNLDPGEASVLQLARQHRCAVLLDDLAARNQAKRAGTPVLGTCGLLVLARRQGMVGPLAPILDDLSRSGYYLGKALIEQTLERAGEQ